MQLKEFKADLIPKIHELDLHAKRRILNILSGNLLTKFKGKGFEFEGYRTFTPEDDASSIDWKASLRSQRLLIREFNVEKNFNVFLLIDASDSMLFGSGEVLKCEFAAQLASNLAFGIIEAGAGVGFGLFTDKLVAKMQPALGKKQYHFLIKELTNVSNYGGKFDLEEAVKFMLGYITTKALVIIISDFIGLKGNWYKFLQILSQKFEVVGMMVRDPRDEELPRDQGQYILEDPYSNQKIYIDSNEYYDLFQKDNEANKYLLKNKFNLLKADFVYLRTDMSFVDSLIRFSKKRASNWS